jgi:biopolymer transport protein TolR
MAHQLSRGRRLMGEINVVPYIDVMLVLLIIFMANSEPLTADLLRNNNPLVLSIDREGRFYLNMGGDPHQVLDEAAVATRAADALQKHADLPVLLKADYRIEYGRVMAAMVILQHAGARKVGFVSDPLPTTTRGRN